MANEESAGSVAMPAIAATLFNPFVQPRPRTPESAASRIKRSVSRRLGKKKKEENLDMLRQKASFGFERKNEVPMWKRTLPHVGLVLMVIVYMASGAFIFLQIESGNAHTNATTPNARFHNQMLNVGQLLHFLNHNPGFKKPSLQLELEQFRQLLLQASIKIDLLNNTLSYDDLNSWDNYRAALLFAFTAVSTIGYGNLAPTTVHGRIFCIVFSVIGIPLFMITVANIGKFLWEGMELVFSKLLQGKMEKEEGKEGKQPSILITATITIVFFLSYIIIGMLILPCWEDLTYVESLYFAFISLTTVGLGDIAPTNATYLPLTLLYLMIGLALTTLAIEILALAFRRLHYVGRKISESAHASIWFGGKMLTVNDLIRSIGREFNVAEHDIHLLGENLDAVLEQAVHEKEETGEITLPPSLPAVREETALTHLGPVELEMGEEVVFQNHVEEEKNSYASSDDEVITEQAKEGGGPSFRRMSGVYDNVPESLPLMSKRSFATLMYMDEDKDLQLLRNKKNSNI